MASLTHGPWVQDPKDTSVTVWFRLDSPGTATLQLDGAAPSSVSVDGSSDYMGSLTVSGLTPGTEYLYSFAVDGVAAVSGVRVRTMPQEGSPGSFVFFQESDFHGNNDAYYGIRQVMGSHASQNVFSVILGDWEQMSDADMETIQDCRDRVKVLRDPSTFPDQDYVRRRHPYLYVWDDWDAFNNNSAGLARPSHYVANRCSTFRETNSLGSSFVDSRAIYRHALVADCLFVFLDGRTYRDPTENTRPVEEKDNDYDYATVQELGPDQVAWAKSVLTTYKTAPFKFLVTGGTWGDNLKQYGLAGPAARDSSGIYFRRERNELIQHIEADADIQKGLFVLTGDDHHLCVRHWTQWRKEEPTFGIGTDATNPLSGEIISSLGVVEVKISAGENGPTVLNQAWNTGTYDKYQKHTTGFAVWEVNTASNPARLICTIYETEEFGSPAWKVLGPVYRFSATPDGVYWPAEDPSSSYTPPASPSSTWTPVVVP